MAADPSPNSGLHSGPHSGPPQKVGATVFFDRRELDAILRLYGRKVAAGEWRDYALESASDYVSFNIHRRTSEAPLYRIEKRPALSRKQGAFALYNAAGLILKRGHELGPVLAVLDKPKFDIL